MEVNSNFLLVPIPIQLEIYLLLWYMSVADPLFETLKYNLCGIVVKIELCTNNLYCYPYGMPISFYQNISCI